MSRLTQNTCQNLAAKLADVTTSPLRLSDLKASLYGKQGRTTDEISYLGTTKSKLSDAWVNKSNTQGSLTEVRDVFMKSQTF